MNLHTTPSPKYHRTPRHTLTQENYQDNNSLQVADTEMKQTVYIYNCNKCTIVVKGKINAITMGACVVILMLLSGCCYVDVAEWVLLCGCCCVGVAMWMLLNGDDNAATQTAARRQL